MSEITKFGELLLSKLDVSSGLMLISMMALGVAFMAINFAIKLVERGGK